MTCFSGIEAGAAKVKAALVDDEKGFVAGASLACAASIAGRIAWCAPY